MVASPQEAESSDASAEDKEPVPTDHDLEIRDKLAGIKTKEAELAKRWDELETEKLNRKLRTGIAIGSLAVMLLEIALASLLFYLFAKHNKWEISDEAISAWLGATVVQVVSVVLVIVNYLFPAPGAGHQRRVNPWARRN